MALTKDVLREWLLRGIEQKSTHVIIAVDTWDYEEYPVFVSAEGNVREKVDSFNEKPDRIMEVYNLSLDIEDQLEQCRVWNL